MSIFGTGDTQMMPTQSVAGAEDERRRQLMAEEAELLKAQQSGHVGNRASRMGQGREDRQASQARIQQSMAIETPEQKQARLAEALNARMNIMSGIIPEEQLQEESYKAMAQEAQKLGMHGIAAESAGKYQEVLTARLKAETEQEKLKATTESAKQNAKVAGQSTHKDIDYDTGNEVEYVTDADGKLINQRITKYPTWSTMEVDGVEMLKNSGNGKMVRTEDPVADAKKRLGDASKAFNIANAEMEKVDRALSKVNNWSIGFLGKTLAEIGSLGGANDVADDAVALKAELESLQASLGFDQLLQLREKGGTLGQIAVYELVMLQSTLTKLDQTTSKEDLTQKLDLVKKHYTKFQNAIMYNASLDDINPSDPAYAEFFETDPATGRKYLLDPITGERWKRVK